MKSLSQSSLTSLSAATLLSAFSPSRNACMVRIPTQDGARCYRNDPYRASVIPSPFKGMTMSPVSQYESLNPSALLSQREIAANLFMQTFSMPPTPTPAEEVVAEKPQATQAPAPRFAYVMFKHEACAYQAPFRISVGDRVFVEGDRGENLGEVIEITTKKPSFPVPSKVLRRATPAEIKALQELRVKEQSSSKLCQSLCDSCGLTVKVMDTEFQSDMNKLTVYFSSRVAHTDFRKVQRCLFREFRCRIWMVNWADAQLASKESLKRRAANQ